MTTADYSTIESVTAERDALIGRMFEATVGAMDLFSVYLGKQLGLYDALVTAGPATSVQLAARAGINERYAREWLEQQAVTGILRVDDLPADAKRRIFSLSAGHAEVLTNPISMAYLAPISQALVGVLSQGPAVLDAYRTGGGVSWEQYGQNAREAQAALNRPAYQTLIASTWIPSLPDVHARLQADPPARVADVGCGYGWSSISIAEGFPTVIVDGFDLDAASIEAGTRNVTAAGLAGRVRLHAAGVDTAEGRYDLVTAFECIHDMADPVGVLRAMREKLAPGGTAIVVDERVAEEFTAPGDLIERFCYGSSISLCLPNGKATPHSAETGAVMRPATFRSYVQQAGFSDIDILPIEHDLFRFYKLVG